MASPAEIVRRWDRREAREKAAKQGLPPPDGFIEMNGKQVPYWLPINREGEQDETVVQGGTGG